jgi:hypothetical protein
MEIVLENFSSKWREGVLKMTLRTRIEMKSVVIMGLE